MSQGDPIPILMNTRAGAMHAESGEQQLQNMAAEIGLDIQVIRTQSKEDFQSELRKLIAAKAPKAAIAGGDGTVGLAVQELAHTQTALGILSQGTFNNFASALRLHHNLPAALRTLKDGTPKAVDLGKIGDRYFTESAGVGLFAESLALYGRGSNKNFLRGLYALTRLSLAFRAQDIQLILDGEAHSGRITLCEVCNTYRIAQAAPVAPKADVDDGLLDIVVFRDVRRRELPAYLRAVRAQMHLGLPKVEVLRAKEIRIEARRPMNVHADDQIIGVTPQTVTVQPGALQVLVDQEL
ncbi:diacylglycerol kinase [Capsulimonas corticalis]|uniref:Diacylglycerol kinase n=1 Tax=Capsulimonas corticalis TaxID=2219043 RepID=A0A402CRE7_9BACT|nr:diacylglycerol kinase family protein [Capsulimonas corticalis]BDI34527.1 diacylglycerol kinase [Capsulimonas corticalis]